jgi:hypothetical protein
MPSEQFSQAVRGSSASPVSVSNRGSLDTNDYPTGDAADVGGGGYPYTINPAETIKELGFSVVAAEIDVEVTTTDGTTFTLPLPSPATFDRWDIDQFVLQDPNNNAARVAYFWAGEA